MLPVAHVEEAGTESGDYERKSGNFVTSYDTREVRQVRFGTYREHQKQILQEVSGQNDREISVFYDPTGNHGKSWFTLHLHERGEGFVVPRSDATAGKLSAFICSSYDWEPYIIIDLPRASTTNPELYECLEDTKDGLVFDHRYHGTTRNIRGSKLILFTNNPINPDLLSWDRWRLYQFNRGTKMWDTISIDQMRSMYEFKQEKKKKRKAKGGEPPKETNPPENKTE